jgi:hypothetical protein
MFGLKAEDLGWQGCLSSEEDVGLRLGRDMQQILPLLLRTSAAGVYVTCEPSYGVRCGEIDSQRGCFSLHIAVGLHLMFISVTPNQYSQC